MSAWDLVLPYDEEARAELRSSGCLSPDIAPGNRAPTVGEIAAAVEALREVLAQHPIALDSDEPDLDWNRPDAVARTFKLRGDRLGAWHLLVALAGRCGQLFVWPSTGEPAVVIQPGMDPARIDTIHWDGSRREDGWIWVCRQLYGKLPGDPSPPMA